VISNIYSDEAGATKSGQTYYIPSRRSILLKTTRAIRLGWPGLFSLSEIGVGHNSERTPLVDWHSPDGGHLGIYFSKTHRVEHSDAIEFIAFDADDTLWHNETFTKTQEKFKHLLSKYLTRWNSTLWRCATLYSTLEMIANMLLLLLCIPDAATNSLLTLLIRFHRCDMHPPDNDKRLNC